MAAIAPNPLRAGQSLPVRRA